MIVRSLKAKIALAVSALVVALMAALTLFVDAYFARQLKQTIAEAQYALVAEVADQLDDKIRLVQSQLVGVTARIRPQHLAGRAEAQAFLDYENDTASLFDNGLFLFSPAGRLLAGTRVEPQLWELDYSGRDYFRRTVESGRPAISDPFQSLMAHRHPIVVLTAPVFDAEGRLAAILAGSFDLIGDNFLAQIGRVRLGQGGYLYLVNTDRTLVVHPDPQRTGRRDVPPGANRLFDRAMQGFEGSGETVTSRGLHALASFKRLKSVNWIVAANYPVAEAHAPVERARRYALVATAAAALLSVAVIWLCMGYLMAPLKRLTGHIRRLSGKACDASPLRVRSRDETGELTEAFNQLMERLCAADRQLRQLTRAVEQSPGVVLITDTEGAITYVNPAFTAVTGFAPGEVLGQNPRLLKSGEQPPEFYRELWRTITAGQEWRGEFHNKRKDGSLYWAAATITPILDEEGRLTHFLGEQEDVTDRRHLAQALRESEARFRQMAANIGEVFWMTPPDYSATLYVSPAFEKVWGRTCAELYAQPQLWIEAIHPDDRGMVLAALDELAGGTEYDIEYRIRRPNGEVRWVSDRGYPIRDDAGQVVLTTGVCADITERKGFEERLRMMAQHDPLTGLPNRNLLADRLEQALAHAERHRQQVGVLFLDIDHFKRINDELGHDAGDQVLKGFAGRLEECVRKSDTVARLGGDEFIIVLAEVPDAESVATVARKIFDGLRTPLPLPDRDFAVATSIGIALYPADGADGETLIKRADLALYQAKQGGRNCYRFFGAEQG
jgi:diguanylate cyclase (GGDEF)-like protein/PAS domain S-box-containing protein